MNKFIVLPCLDKEQREEINQEDLYEGHVVPLANVHNPNFILFFPIDSEHAKLVNRILQEDYDQKDFSNSSILTVYHAMLNSWKAGGRYLSGILFNSDYDEVTQEDTILPTFIISDSVGHVDSIVNVTFLNAIMTACLERKEIMVANVLLEKLMPDFNFEEEINEDEDFFTKKQDNPFPIDRQILEIAKNIMGGKNKGDS